LAALAAAGVLLVASAPFLTAPLAALVYAFGSLVCHQTPERSFHLQGFQLAVCARCFGLYSGAALGAVWAASSSVGTRPSVSWVRDVRALTVAAAIPTVVTVVLEWAGWWQPSNVTRSIAGAPLGFVVSWVVIRALASGDPAASPPS
jgi:uncharacterized membrane protein